MVTAGTVDQVAIPSMRRIGCSDEQAAGFVAAGGTLANLFPPGELTAP